MLTGFVKISCFMGIFVTKSQNQPGIPQSRRQMQGRRQKISCKKSTRKQEIKEEKSKENKTLKT